jgi:hypothetical protein
MLRSSFRPQGPRQKELSNRQADGQAARGSPCELCRHVDQIAKEEVSIRRPRPMFSRARLVASPENRFAPTPTRYPPERFLFMEPLTTDPLRAFSPPQPFPHPWKTALSWPPWRPSKREGKRISRL